MHAQTSAKLAFSIRSSSIVHLNCIIIELWSDLWSLSLSLKLSPYMEIIVFWIFFLQNWIATFLFGGNSPWQISKGIIRKNDFDILTPLVTLTFSHNCSKSILGWSPDYVQQFLKISQSLISSFFSNLVNRRTERETDRQTDNMWKHKIPPWQSKNLESQYQSYMVYTIYVAFETEAYACCGALTCSGRK